MPNIQKTPTPLDDEDDEDIEGSVDIVDNVLWKTNLPAASKRARQEL
jgi:hypothetical protein